MPIKVAIVEDDAGVREGLKRILSRAPDFEFLASYISAEVALKELAQNVPDVLLMDINLPGMNGVECVRQLHLLQPSLRVVMLTVYENPEQIFNALSAGAIGYLLKHTPPEELLSAIRDAHQGGGPDEQPDRPESSTILPCQYSFRQCGKTLGARDGSAEPAGQRFSD